MVQDFNSLIELINYFDSEQKCIDYLAKVRWPEQVHCPYCEHTHCYQLKGKNKRWKCANCRKQFSVRVGTIFEDSKITLKKWFIAVYLITSHRKGISSLQLSRDLKVTQKTAWFMLHRIRYALNYQKDSEPKSNGETEVDETYIGGKDKNKHASKKPGNSQGRSMKSKTPVFGMFTRGEGVKMSIISKASKSELQGTIQRNIEKGAIIYSDDWTGYIGLNQNYKHTVISHSKGEYVRGTAHTNNIENFWSILKRGHMGGYHYMSNKHLKKYSDEFVFRYNLNTFDENARFNLFLNNVKGRLTYKELKSNE